MRYKKEAGKIHIVLDVGEEVIESLLELARKEEISSAALTGIGALGDPTLGYFDLDRKEYLKKDFPGSWELVSLTGSLSWDGNDPVAHVHAALGGPDYTVRAGHLFQGRVSITAEIFLSLNQTRIERKADDRFGLKLIDM